MSIKRYAVVGEGSRASMFNDALLKKFKDQHQLVAMLDSNQTRMDHKNRMFLKDGLVEKALPTYKPDQFEEMIKKENITNVIVVCIDNKHHDYIARAMYAGCDVISEKPMTTDVEKAKIIKEAISKTGKILRVTFNYRYSPRNSKVKELIMNGAIGDIHSVHFEWFLNTQHGADYFRRWHRDKKNSGGLMVHKSTHHFDLVNWWLDTSPESVFAMGQLAFYGKENGERNGLRYPYTRSTGSPDLEQDPFGIDLKNGGMLEEAYLKAEHEDGYIRDQNVFNDGISIEDDASVLVKYKNKATMTYHLTAYSPCEGYRVAFNGSKGRLELDVEESAYISGAENDPNRVDIREGEDFELKEPSRILLRPHWSKPQIVEIKEAQGGHGGGDARMLEDIFLAKQEDPLKRIAGFNDGVSSIICGISANESFMTQQPVQAGQLLKEIHSC